LHLYFVPDLGVLTRFAVTGEQTKKVTSFSCAASFSGPKTAVLRACQQLIGKGFDFPSFKALWAPLSSEGRCGSQFQRIAIGSQIG